MYFIDPTYYILDNVTNRYWRFPRVMYGSMHERIEEQVLHFIVQVYNRNELNHTKSHDTLVREDRDYYKGDSLSFFSLLYFCVIAFPSCWIFFTAVTRSIQPRTFS